MQQSQNGLVLKPEYQELADDFERHFGFGGCSCFISAPCGYCTHEGNPMNLEETPDAWEPEPTQAA